MVLRDSKSYIQDKFSFIIDIYNNDGFINQSGHTFTHI